MRLKKRPKKKKDSELSDLQTNVVLDLGSEQMLSTFNFIIQIIQILFIPIMCVCVCVIHLPYPEFSKKKVNPNCFFTVVFNCNYEENLSLQPQLIVQVTSVFSGLRL